jgi:hypothetical protein
VTLIAVYNSEGCVGRCDSRCYSAKDADCSCVCGGRNHGKGLDQATENTRDYAARIVAENHRQHPGARVSLDPQDEQADLFAGGYR